jgi:hypothetical protein
MNMKYINVAGFLISKFSLLTAFPTSAGVTREKINALVE